MKRLLTVAAVFATVLVAGTAFAAQKTVKLAVENMYCASCPYIVQQSLAGVPGVSNVDVSFRLKTAMVTFDDAKTNVETLTGATFDSGYPSKLAENDSSTPSEANESSENWFSKLKLFN